VHFFERIIELLRVLLIYMIERVIDLYYQAYNLSDLGSKRRLTLLLNEYSRETKLKNLA